MLSVLPRAVKRIVSILFERFPPPQDLCPVPSVILANNSNLRQIQPIQFELSDLLDGWFWATPKRRTPLRQKWKEKYADDNWQIGQKMIKSRGNITTCPDCGSFHQFHTICRTCFERVQKESEEIIKTIRKAWGRGVIDKEVQVVYKGETAPDTNKRIVELERPRPLWFAPNLSQLTANPAKEVIGDVNESVEQVARVKETKDTPK